jgi:hypothetical protein
MTAVFQCCDDRRRRNEIAALADVNGIDFLEVLDTPAQPAGERQRILFVHFLHDPGGLGIEAGNVAVVGGERIRDPRVLSAVVGVDARSGSTDPVLTVEVANAGDFSPYTLELRPTDTSGLPGLDPVLRSVEFSFKVNCDTGFDPLQPREPCAPEPVAEPALDYLARDYLSLRQMVLDRMAVLVPDWQERNAADLGVALLELLAYVGDLVAYRQDAVATEAYLDTCRQRTSARRHARLVDYAMHDGCNARAWIHVRLADDSPPFELGAATFYAAVSALPPVIRPGSREEVGARDSGAEAFELLSPLRLTPEHNEIRFYTWGARECCLPKGAVRATLRGALPDLRPGMVLIFQEVRSPRTGDPDDADLGHRHAVLLTEVTHASDPVGARFGAPPAQGAVPVTEVRWADADALPFPVCVSAETAEEYGAAFVDDVSVALGNVVLADHGSVVAEDLGVVPHDTLRQVRAVAADETDRCRPDRTTLARARFRPRLGHGPLTQAAPYDPDDPPASATEAMRFRAADAVPAITLADGSTEPWEPRLDLLSSRTLDKHFVVEVEADGRGHVRFGDGTHGARPGAGDRFTARYRVGNGRAGNVGAEALAHVLTGEDGIASITNPLAAHGGVEPETIDEVLTAAPVAFRPQTLAGQPGRPDGATLGRAVTPADYAAVTETHPAVQRAAATFRWTGSWRTVSVTVDPLGGGPVDAGLERALADHVEMFRLAGHDVEIEPPRAVALMIAMTVDVAPGYFASAIRAALLDIFSSRVLPDGRRGLFHPDNLTFGQTVYLSPLYAAAQALDGVRSVDITTFERRDRPGGDAVAQGRLKLGRLEIPRLDNDPSAPERGVLSLTMAGGR